MWLFRGGIAMGIGVWAMDSAMGMRYSPGLTALSMAIAMAASLFALWFVLPAR
jgi:NO-binding membrane sensor protein with MHYT domain